jgi:hypothetical protein
MRAGGPATAEGDLERTPFAHVLVYAVDRQLTGAMFLNEPSGTQHVLRFVRGIPVKVRSSDGFARFGELLLEEGLITAETLADALATTGLLGDVLLLSGCIDGPTLHRIAQTQFVRRMVHLFELPSGTTYRYFDGHDALADWGGEPADVEPLAVLWAGLRAHGERSTRIQSTLDLLGATPLRLHLAFEPGRFGLCEPEIGALAPLQASAPSLAALLESGVAPQALLRKLIYALVISRYIDLGAGSVPVGLDEPWSSSFAPTSSQALGRVQLRATVHRVGAAAPDPPGDGERAPMQLRTRRRDAAAAQPQVAASAAGPVPTSTRGSLVGAVAAELSYDPPHHQKTEGEPVPMDGDRESGISASVDVAPPASKRRVRNAPPEPAADAAAESRAAVEERSVITLSPGEITAERALEEASCEARPPSVVEPAAEPAPASAGGRVSDPPSATNG